LPVRIKTERVGRADGMDELQKEKEAAEQLIIMGSSSPSDE
jgi:hypothetical protein